MTTKADFDAEQWQLILDVPVMIGMGVMIAGKSGLGTMKESFAMTKEMIDAVKGHSDNELIQSVVNARLKDKEKSSAETLSNNPYAGQGREALVDAAVEKCQQVCTLLNEKCSEAEAMEYKQWSMHIGEKVAMAASEGGFLGFGGVQVSEEEKQALARISQALGVEAFA